MNYWMNQGAPAQKLNLGIAFYGQVYTVDSTCSGVGAPVNSPGTHGIYTQVEGKWAYYEVKVHGTKLRKLYEYFLQYKFLTSSIFGLTNFI